MIALDREQAPQFQQVKDITFLSSELTSLDNGIVVHSLNGGSQEILKIDFIFKAGTYFQKSALIANSTNQLIKEGTKSYSSFEIAEGIDQYGAFLDTETSYDTSTITLYTLSKHLEKVLPFIYEIILLPKFSEKEFLIYKNNALEKFKVNQEKVSFVARQKFIESIFEKENPYGLIATAADFENLSLEKIKAFHKTHYSLNNCEIIISGNINKNVAPFINQFFGAKKLEKRKSEKQTYDSPLRTNSVFIEKENALQSAIRIGRKLPNKLHKDYFGLQVFNTILGGYFGSRLMKNIREDKGFTYGIGSGIISLQNDGYFFISTEVGSDNTKEALSEIYKEIELLRTEKIPQQELDLVKNYLLGQLLKSCDGPFKMASLFENVHFYGLDYDFYNNYINTIKEITPKTLMDLGIKYFKKSDLTEVVVGKI
jgi:zinc protease